jgi:diguanylate cyclase
MSVLVVEDDADSRDLFDVILTTCGARVRAVDSARGAVVACEEAIPDVIVSDLAMPVHDGFALLRALRTRDACRDVPAIAVTGFRDHQARALDAGFAEFLTKPVVPTELCARVARYARA